MQLIALKYKLSINLGDKRDVLEAIKPGNGALSRPVHPPRKYPIRGLFMLVLIDLRKLIKLRVFSCAIGELIFFLCFEIIITRGSL